MGRVEKSIEIEASPEKVWEMIALDRVIEWEEGWKGELKSIEYTSEVRKPKDKLRAGATAHGIPKKQRESVKFDLEITESLENEKMMYCLDVGKFSVMVTYNLEPIEDGTKFTYAVDYEMPWSILGKIIEKTYYHRHMEKEYERSLKNFKSILEK